jgi:alpha-beta hydrolase superfamily lysophospholipase
VLIIFVLTLFVLLILFIGLIGWLVSSSLRVRASRLQAELRILSMTEETITLPRLPKTVVNGTYGITWPNGNALVGEITDLSERTVTRRVIKATEGLSTGLPVRWNKFVYRGNPQTALGLPYEEVHIPGRLGDLPAWLVPGERETWVLLVHGFHATREEALRALPTLSEMGFPALVMTYRNDAGAPQSPDHLYHLGDTEWEDVEAGVSYALSHGARDVILFGWSMGGCIVETFLHRSPSTAHIRAVVLDSPILNWQRVLEAQVQLLHLPRSFSYPIKWMVTWRANINFALFNYELPTDETPIPTLLFHGTADTQAPVASSDLFAQARPNLVTYLRVAGANHTLVWNADPHAYTNALKTFLNQITLHKTHTTDPAIALPPDHESR